MRRRLILSTLASLSVVLAARAQETTPSAAANVDLDAVDAWLASWADAGFFSGSLLVARGDAIVYERCFGDANLELGVPITPETRFAIASITKPMQVVLLARLVDAGVLTPGDSISQWIDGFPSGDSLTVIQLTNHEARVPHRVTEPGDEISARSAADMVELVKERGLLEDTDGESVYSSAGYSVLARILELAGDDAWDSLMQREVFDRAGMDQTIHPSERRLIPQRASSYVWTPEGYRHTDPKDLSFLVGAGSLYSTPRDVFRFIRALRSGTFGETVQPYLVRDNGDVITNGRTNGYRAFADYHAEHDLTVAVCANVVTGATDRIRDAIPVIFSGGAIPTVELPDLTRSIAVEVDLTVYEGSFQLRPGSNLGVRATGNNRLDVDGWMLLPLQDEHTFFCVQDFGKVVFEFDDDGTVTHLVWGPNAYQMDRVGDVE